MSRLLSFLILLSVLLALGFWQVQRLGEKEALLAHIAARAAMAPRPLPVIVEDPAAWEFRKVTLAGRWLKDMAFFVGPRVKDGKSGYHAIIPFLRVSKGIVMVNAGWVPVPEVMALPQGATQVSGMVVLPRKARFTPPNDPEKDRWYWADVAAMAADGGMTGVPPLVITPDGVMPGIPNNHRAYAAFWFGMALILCVIFGLFTRRKPG